MDMPSSVSNARIVEAGYNEKDRRIRAISEPFEARNRTEKKLLGRNCASISSVDGNLLNIKENYKSNANTKK